MFKGYLYALCLCLCLVWILLCFAFNFALFVCFSSFICLPLSRCLFGSLFLLVMPPSLGKHWSFVKTKNAHKRWNTKRLNEAIQFNFRSRESAREKRGEAGAYDRFLSSSSRLLLFSWVEFCCCFAFLMHSCSSMDVYI